MGVGFLAGWSGFQFKKNPIRLTDEYLGTYSFFRLFSKALLRGSRVTIPWRGYERADTEDSNIMFPEGAIFPFGGF